MGKLHIFLDNADPFLQLSISNMKMNNLENSKTCLNLIQAIDLSE